MQNNYDENFNTGAPANSELSLNCPPIRVVEIGIGEKIIVASDFLISNKVDAELTLDCVPHGRFIETISSWDGPGTIVISGNFLDLLTQTDNIELIESEIFATLKSLASRAKVKIYLLPGLRDARLAFDRDLVEKLQKFFPFELALKIELHVETIEGIEKVLITSGREFDPVAKAVDPYSPFDTPWAHHLLSDFWPKARTSNRLGWLDGIERITDPSTSARFLISRLAYRKAARFIPWVLLPLFLSFLIKLPLVLSLPGINRLKDHAISLGPRLAFIGVTTVLDAALISIVFLFLLRRSYSRFLTEESTISKKLDLNLDARLGAASLIDQGYKGVITGHFLSPELSEVGSGFFACTGSVSTIYSETEAILGLPSIFRPKQQATWIELDAGAKVHVRLISKTKELKADSLLERFLTFDKSAKKSTSGLLSSYPDGPDYRDDTVSALNQRRPRRIASSAIFLIGTLNLASALTPPFRSRLRFIQEFIPISISQTADALVAMAGIGLIALAGGVRRGQKQAWILALGLSIGAATLNIVKGGDVEEALVLILLSAYLITKRECFQAPTNRLSIARGIRTLILGVVAIVIFSATIIFLYVSTRRHHFAISYTNSLLAVSERMVGFSGQPLPHGIDEFAAPALAFSGLSLAAIALFLAFRPVVDRSMELGLWVGAKSERERARAIVTHYSKGTLDYFALRDDKRYFFAHGCVIAYANYGSVALVSPDPVGPDTTKREAWREFSSFASHQGWIVAVLGADESWLDTYQATGMHSIYVGDEAVVTLKSFHLDGKKNKGLRQAVGRMKKYGYTCEFHDPSEIEAELADGIKAVMGQSRKGDAERGFSMTLGRLFDPKDKGLLLTVCKNSEGRVVGFCQWVPAPGIHGFSLDLMRRDLGDHPNGLTDFMIVSTIEYLLDREYEHLSLNFATMRAVLSGEMDSLPQRVEKWFLKRMSESMQIESLWRFNSKFYPTWHPRYAVYDNIEHLPAIAMAIARAEAFWELPIIGRFLAPADTN